MAVGSYFSPKPVDADLAAMPRAELLAYSYRLRSQEFAAQDGRASFPDMPSRAPMGILRQQAEAAKVAQDQSPRLAGALEMPLADLRTWIDACCRPEDAI